MASKQPVSLETAKETLDGMVGELCACGHYESEHGYQKAPWHAKGRGTRPCHPLDDRCSCTQLRVRYWRITIEPA